MSSLKVWAICIGMGGLFAFLYHYHSISIENVNMKGTIAVQESALKEQAETIRNLKETAEKRDKIVGNTVKSFQNVEKIENIVNSRLEKKKNGDDRDLTVIAERHPGVMKDIINNATANVFRCFEVVSGSKLTENEIKNGNTQCPNLFENLSN